MHAGMMNAVEQWIQARLGLSEAIVESIVWTLLALVLYALFRLIASLIIESRAKDTARRYFLLKSTNYTLGFTTILVIVAIWFGNVTGMAAYLGILSAGLAIALQDPVTNFAGWIFIAIRKPFAVGDRIEIGDLRGDVVDMRLFQFTLVEIGNWVDADQSTGRIIHVPNGWVFKQSTANYTQGFNFIWHELPVVVTFESDWEKAKEILLEISEKHSIVKDFDAQNQVKKAARRYLIQFQHLTPIVWTSVVDMGINLTIRYICDPRKRRSTEMHIWEDILRAFGATDNIDFAYPTTRFYDNTIEGKLGARAERPVRAPSTSAAPSSSAASGHRR